MRRRDFIQGIAGTAVTWPLTARAQQPAKPVIGFLHPGSAAGFRFLADVHHGLAQAGYIEGRNLIVEYRWADNRLDQLPALASDLVRRQVAVIMALQSTAAAFAVKAATQTIPIVFFVGPNPVEIGLVRSLSHPGGNVTGVTSLSVETTAKRLELIHELVPTADLMGILVNPANRNFAESVIKVAEGAVRILGVRLLILNASSHSEIEAAFATLVRERAGGLVITSDQLFTNNLDLIAALAARHAVPAIEQQREFVSAGGLMSYGTDYQATYRQVGSLTGRVLNGDRPADLPVQEVTKHELVINLKAAKSMGLTIPLPLLGRADGMIE